MTSIVIWVSYISKVLLQKLLLLYPYFQY